MVKLRESSDKYDISDIYKEYNETVKPLIAQIEAAEERLPLPILNEIRATHDHLSRCYFSDADENFKLKQIECARGHNMRTILDCLKILNSIYKAETEKLEKRTNIERINSGKFYIEYSNLLNEAETLCYQAKLVESKSKENSIELYEKATAKYNKIHNLILSNRSSIAWAYIRFYERPCWTFVLMIISAVFGYAFPKLAELFYGTISK